MTTAPSRQPLVSLIFVVTCFLYFLLPTCDFYWDGIAFALKIESSSSLAHHFQPNHLLYPFPFYPLWKWLTAIGLPVRSLFLMAGLNKILSSITAALVALLMLKWSGSRIISGAIACAFAFSATWWKFSTDANAYIASVLLLLLAFCLLDERPVSLRRALAAAALHAGAMLLHQLAFWFYLPALFLISPRRWRSGLAYIALTLTLIVPAYIAVYLWADIPFRDQGFTSWLTYHTEDAPFTFSLATNLSQALQSNLRLFFGGKAGSVQSLASVLIGCAVLTAGLAASSRLPPSAPVPDDKTRRLALLLWIVPYLLFFIIWRPQDTFHRLFYIAPFWLLAGFEMARRAVRPRFAIGIAALLFAFNFIFFIYPQSKPSNKPSLAFAIQQRSRWPPGTCVAYRDFHTDLWTIAYFSPQVSWLGMDSAEPLDRYFRQCPSLWLEETAYDSLRSDPAGQAWLQHHQLAQQIYRSAHQSFRFYRVLD